MLLDAGVVPKAGVEEVVELVVAPKLSPVAGVWAPLVVDVVAPKAVVVLEVVELVEVFAPKVKPPPVAGA